MLALEDVVLQQGDFELRADCTVPAGRKVAIIGPSGAGKSTLLAALAGFLPLHAGRLRWQGTDLDGLPPGQRPMAMLFQDNNLFPHLSLAQNVGLGLRADLRLNATDKHQVEGALEQVGLAGLGNRKPAALSGGQQSRGALARILVQERPLILLDEPFSALGPALRVEMLELVATLTDRLGATLLMVSHEPGDAARIADDLMLVADGVAHPPADFARTMADPPEALRAYLG